MSIFLLIFRYFSKAWNYHLSCIVTSSNAASHKHSLCTQQTKLWTLSKQTKRLQTPKWPMHVFITCMYRLNLFNMTWKQNNSEVTQLVIVRLENHDFVYWQNARHFVSNRCVKMWSVWNYFICLCLEIKLLFHCVCSHPYDFFVFCKV